MSPKALTREEKDRMYAVKTYVLNHLDESYPIKRLARMALMSEGKFKDAFYRLFEMKPGEYVHEARMQMGRFLLRKSENSIKEVAAMTGYNKVQNFSRAFKKFFGVRPGSIQRENT